MSAKANNNEAKIIRVGRYWVDKALLDEGYGIEDIFEDDYPLELPELIDPRKRRKVCWFRCPECGELSQATYQRPTCNFCDWGNKDVLEPKTETEEIELQCAA